MVELAKMMSGEAEGVAMVSRGNRKGKVRIKSGLGKNRELGQRAGCEVVGK